MFFALLRKKPVDLIIFSSSRQVGVGESLARRVAGEQRRRDQVDADVGALGGEDGGDQKLQRRLVIEAQWASG